MNQYINAVFNPKPRPYRTPYLTRIALFLFFCIFLGMFFGTFVASLGEASLHLVRLGEASLRVSWRGAHGQSGATVPTVSSLRGLRWGVARTGAKAGRRRRANQRGPSLAIRTASPRPPAGSGGESLRHRRGGSHGASSSGRRSTSSWSRRPRPTRTDGDGLPLHPRPTRADGDGLPRHPRPTRTDGDGLPRHPRPTRQLWPGKPSPVCGACEKMFARQAFACRVQCDAMQ